MPKFVVSGRINKGFEFELEADDLEDATEYAVEKAMGSIRDWDAEIEFVEEVVE